jgi:glutaredoxin
MELYQAEWCPHSHKVRERLTEIQQDFIARQVPAEEDERDDLERATGQREIPALVTDSGDVVCGEDDILTHLDRIAAWPPPTASSSRRTTKRIG